MSNLEGFKFAKTHEWIKKDGDQFLVGISEYAQGQLGDIVYVDFPEIDESFDSGTPFGELESSKAVSEINMPVSGKIIEINQDLEDSPENINSDPYNSWIIKIEAKNSDDFENLLDRDEA